MKSVKVNKEKCIGCGACVSIAPNVFDFDDDGLSKAKVLEVENTNSDVDTAKDCCPTGAIEVKENEKKEDLVA